MIYVYNNQFGGFHALLVLTYVLASYGYFLEEKKTVFVGHEILMPQNLFKFIGLLYLQPHKTFIQIAVLN